MEAPKNPLDLIHMDYLTRMGYTPGSADYTLGQQVLNAQVPEFRTPSYQQMMGGLDRFQPRAEYGMMQQPAAGVDASQIGANFFATPRTPEEIYAAANQQGMTAGQLANYYTQATPGANYQDVLGSINTWLSQNNKTLGGGGGMFSTGGTFMDQVRSSIPTQADVDYYKAQKDLLENPPSTELTAGTTYEPVEIDEAADWIVQNRHEQALRGLNLDELNRVTIGGTEYYVIPEGTKREI